MLFSKETSRAKHQDRSQRREAAQNMKFLIKIGWLGTWVLMMYSKQKMLNEIKIAFNVIV